MRTDQSWGELLAYCRLTPEELSEEDARLLESFEAAAEGYLAGAGVVRPEDGAVALAQYELCVRAMVLDALDHRGGSQGAAMQENPVFRRMVCQLKV